MLRAAALAAAVVLAAAGCSQAKDDPASAPPRLQPLWTLEGLSSPESVVLSGDGRFLYVSNVGGEGDARDGDGFISRVSRDGAMIEQRWATGFDAPKGMALKDGRLYVADITRLWILDTVSGGVIARLDAPDAGFLNDVALLPDGRIIVADSAKQRIYALDGQSLVAWIEAPLLQSVNGLLPEDDRLVITTMQGRLLAADYRTRTLTVLAEGIGDGDGVARLPDGSYLVSEWPGRMFHVRQGAPPAVVQDTREAERFMNDFILVDGVLIVPNWKPGTLSAYRVGG